MLQGGRLTICSTAGPAAQTCGAACCDAAADESCVFDYDTYEVSCPATQQKLRNAVRPCTHLWEALTLTQTLIFASVRPCNPTHTLTLMLA